MPAVIGAFSTGTSSANGQSVGSSQPPGSSGASPGTAVPAGIAFPPDTSFPPGVTFLPNGGISLSPTRVTPTPGSIQTPPNVRQVLVGNFDWYHKILNGLWISAAISPHDWQSNFAPNNGFAFMSSSPMMWTGPIRFTPFGILDAHGALVLQMVSFMIEYPDLWLLNVSVLNWVGGNAVYLPPTVIWLSGPRVATGPAASPGTPNGPPPGTPNAPPTVRPIPTKS